MCDIIFRHVVEGEKDYEHVKNHLEKMKDKAKSGGTIKKLPEIKTDMIKTEALLKEMMAGKHGHGHADSKAADDKAKNKAEDKLKHTNHGTETKKPAEQTGSKKDGSKGHADHKDRAYVDHQDQPYLDPKENVHAGHKDKTHGDHKDKILPGHKAPESGKPQMEHKAPDAHKVPDAAVKVPEAHKMPAAHKAAEAHKIPESHKGQDGHKIPDMQKAHGGQKNPGAHKASDDKTPAGSKAQHGSDQEKSPKDKHDHA
jgi:hypothetical protein